MDLIDNLRGALMRYEGEVRNGSMRFDCFRSWVDMDLESGFVKVVSSGLCQLRED